MINKQQNTLWKSLHVLLPILKCTEDVCFVLRAHTSADNLLTVTTIDT